MPELVTCADTGVQPKQIQVIGVGRGGGNTLNHMITQNIRGVDFVFTATDAKAIEQSLAATRLQLPASCDAETGEYDRILEIIDKPFLVIIVAGMGGKTGSQVAPIVAKAAKSAGAFVISVVSEPLRSEGTERMGLAMQGLEALSTFSDSVFTIPLQRLNDETHNIKPDLEKIFGIADDTSLQAVRGIAELISQTGYRAKDYAEIMDLLSEDHGVSLIGSGVSSGRNRAIEATKRAISSPILNGVKIQDAKWVLLNMSGNKSMRVEEYDEAVAFIHHMVDEDTKIICGLVYDEKYDDSIRVTLFTGL